MATGSMVAVPCVQGQYDEAAKEACLIGCHEGACLLVTQIAAGDAHSCAALSDGSVRCWGANAQKQLGRGDSGPATVTPAPVVGLSGVVSITVSGGTSCALDKDGQVRCWGANDHAQSGAPGGVAAVPVVSVALTKPALKVALGASHGCALLDDGRVACWGRGHVGQLGEGHTGAEFENPVPVLVTGLGTKKVVDLALGGDRSCVLYDDGSLACWGAVLGSGEVFAGSSSAKAVTAVTTKAEAIATGPDVVCATGPGGVILCAGANDKGQLGDGDADPSSTFAFVQGDEKPVGGAVEILLGLAFGCLRQEASLRCWGDNGVGQLGAGSGGISTHARPVDAVGSGAVNVALGRQHACAIVQQRRGVQCWGANDSGQVGHGATSPISAVGSVVW